MFMWRVAALAAAHVAVDVPDTCDEDCVTLLQLRFRGAAAGPDDGDDDIGPDDFSGDDDGGGGDDQAGAPEGLDDGDAANAEPVSSPSDAPGASDGAEGEGPAPSAKMATAPSMDTATAPSTETGPPADENGTPTEETGPPAEDGNGAPGETVPPDAESSGGAEDGELLYILPEKDAYTYLGCVRNRIDIDGHKRRIVDLFYASAPTMTVEQCYWHCRRKGAYVFALEQHTDCRCTDEPAIAVVAKAKSVPERRCNAYCEGGSGVCGGTRKRATSLYVATTYPPSDESTATEEESCAALSQRADMPAAECPFHKLDPLALAAKRSVVHQGDIAVPAEALPDGDLKTKLLEMNSSTTHHLDHLRKHYQAQPGVTTRTQLPPKWTRGEVPYRFEHSCSSSPRLRKVWEDAMGWWEKHTCIRFTKNGTPHPGGHILKLQCNECCWAYMGMYGHPQYNEGSIGPGSSVANAAHELGHSLGLSHTQSRPDRDQHVEPIWPTIRRLLGQEMLSQYNIETGAVALAPYRFDDLMHYSWYWGGGKIFKAKRPVKNGESFEESQYLSSSDIANINLFYGCGADPGEATQADKVEADTCVYAKDGACDVPTYCASGTDCTDCGTCSAKEAAKTEKTEAATAETVETTTEEPVNTATEWKLKYEGSSMCLGGRRVRTVLTEVAKERCNNFQRAAQGATFPLKVGRSCVDFFWNQGKFGLWRCHGGENQKFAVVGGKLCNAIGKCLHIASGDDTDTATTTTTTTTTTTEEPEQSTSSTDDCACDQTGVIRGFATTRPGCKAHIAGDSAFCYIHGGGGCPGAQASGRHPTIFWKDCEESAKPRGPCKSWCATKRNPWHQKCGWRRSCSGCSQCGGLAMVATRTAQTIAATGARVAVHVESWVPGDALVLLPHGDADARALATELMPELVARKTGPAFMTLALNPDVSPDLNFRSPYVAVPPGRYVLARDSALPPSLGGKRTLGAEVVITASVPTAPGEPSLAELAEGQWRISWREPLFDGGDDKLKYKVVFTTKTATTVVAESEELAVLVDAAAIACEQRKCRLHVEATNGASDEWVEGSAAELSREQEAAEGADAAEQAADVAADEEAAEVAADEAAADAATKAERKKNAKEAKQAKTGAKAEKKAQKKKQKEESANAALARMQENRITPAIMGTETDEADERAAGEAASVDLSSVFTQFA